MELIRQLEVFRADKHKDKRIDIIGIGATGSYVLWLLAKIGLTNIHVWDHDKIEDHNIPNQCYFLRHIGKPKVTAAHEMVKAGAGIKIVKHQKKVEEEEEFGQIVFLLVDRMEDREKIWQDSLKFKLRTEFLIETRMGADSGRVYTLNPSKPSHVKAWEKTLYSDDEAEVSACGTSISIAPTASLVASMAVWQLIKYLNNDNVENEILISSRPFAVISRNF